MAEFKLGRIKFVWKGNWTGSTVYYIDDVVRYGGRTYICVVGHTSDADFNTDLEYSPSKWNQMSDGQEWKGDWTTNTFYKLNDIVKYGGLLYICNDSHTSSVSAALGLENDQSKWTIFAEGLDWKGVWTVSTRYKVNDLVRYGGYTYVCNTAHTSASTTAIGLEGNQAFWDDFNPGLQYKGAWVTATRYKLNDVVKYGAGLWICVNAHAASLTFAADSAYWNQFVEGVEFEDNWLIGTTYQPGDIVRYGGNQYVAKTISTGSNPLTGTSDWDLFTEGFKFQAEWANNTSYKIGEVVSYGGYTYLAATDSPAATYSVTAVIAATDRFTIADTTGIAVGMTVRFTGTTFGNVFTTARYYVKTVGVDFITVSTTSGGATFNITADASGTMTATVSAEPPNAAYWTKLNSGIRWQGAWADDTEYRLGDAVRYGSNAYICVQAHRSEADDGSTVGATGGGQPNSRPDQDATGVYWNALSLGSETDILTTRGDLVYFGGSGPTRLPVGIEGQVLVSNGTDPEWRTLGKIDHVYYVAPNGVDLPYPVHGGTLDKPWKTIRYACEQVDKGPRHPNAQKLLELNRAFIQREVSSWIRYQIDNNLSPFSKVTATSITGSNTLNTDSDHGLIAGRTLRAKSNTNGIVGEVDYYVIAAGLTATAFRVSLTPNGPAVGTLVNGTGLTINFVFDYDEYKCERDVGYIVDRLIWDIGHGGNLKIRAAAQSLLGVLDEGPFSAAEEDRPYITLASEKEEGVAAYEYMQELVTAVLSNTAPSTIYQNVIDDSSAIVAQYFVSDVAEQAETGTITTATSLIDVVITALSTLDSSTIPERSVPNNTINVKSGRYREVLPIIVPAETCILGDEVRSTNAGPAGSLVSRDDVKYSVEALGRLETVVGQIVVGTNVTESSGNTAIQDAAWPYASSTEVDAIQRLVRTMEYRIDYETGSALTFSSTDPTGYNTVAFLQGYGDARKLIKENKEFFKAEIIAFIAENYPNVKYSKTKCKRDIGYIVDAMVYDLTYGGRTQILNAGLAYYDGPGSNLMIDSTEIAATVAAYGRLKTVMQQVIANTTVTKTVGNTATQWTDVVNLTSGSLASTFVGGGIDIVTNIISGDSTTGQTPQIMVTTIATNNTLTSNNHGLALGDAVVPRLTSNGLTAGVKYWVVGTVTTNTFQLSATYGGSTLASFTNGTGLDLDLEVIDYPTATNAVNTTTALITAAQTLDAAQETIVTSTTTFISTNYPSLVYNTTKCERDVRLILEAVMFDFMFNSNVQTLNAAYSYLRSSASDVFDLGQKAATRAAFANVRTLAKANVGGNATAQARIDTLMILLDDIVYGATNEGSICQTDIRAADHARLQLERNRDYIVSEISAYIESTNKTTVTAVTAASETFTCASTAWMQRNAAIRFSGTVFGGVVAGTTYYVQNVINSTTFQISATRNANTPFEISNDGSGSMTVSLYYDTASCERDVHAYIDALKFDLMYPGNYRSKLAARYYANAVMGSLEEDMYYVRNGTGIRNQTLEGLTGDLLAPNEYGTSRVSAGAYVSLDPGWGPNDFRTWIISRSPYVQNVTTFGYAAVGQKIDGALHAGGNDSIVSNDFTQVISDGIGAWITNNGRAELVSVFTYYAHIGYLAEGGGRIRATNGNNSYGDFGSVAEGFDTTEVEGTGVVDNRSFVSTVGSVFTDAADDILQFEFENAGTDYTDVTWTISGAGTNASVIQDEFRDDAVFTVRLLDNVDDSTNAPESDGNFGGLGYVSNSNTAQGGTTTQITIAATDQEISSAYIGMKIYLTGGAGVGQYGIIATFNAGTKVATITKETTGAPGWDHIIAGTTIVSPDASTTYTIEPRITFTAPPYLSSARTLATSMTYADVGYVNLYKTYLGLGVTGGSGTGATFDVVRRGTKYSLVALKNAGTGYTRLNTLTIAGTSLNGTSPTNNITITITAVNETTGAILTYEYTGMAQGGNYVAISAGTRTTNTSVDAINWTERLLALPATNTWTAMAAGEVRTSVSAGSFVVGTAYKILTVGTTAFTAIGASENTVGKIFIATAVGAGSGTAMPLTTSIVAISSGGTGNAYSTDGGITWTSGAALPSSGTWSAIAYGNGIWMAVRSGSNATAYSTDGGATWLAGGNLPASTTWTGVAYGGGKWVAIASGGIQAALSLDNGATWTDQSLPTSSDWISVSWGNNRFVAVSNSSGTAAAYSLTGASWVASTIPSAQYTDVRYGQGVFLAVSQSTQAASSEDGLVWTSRTTSTAANGFSACIFGNPNQTGVWSAVQRSTASTVASSFRLGATAKARSYVSQEKIFAIRMLEPGSGYYTGTPTMTITDPNNIYEAPFTVRTGKGAIAQPSWINRGTGYVSAAADILTGDGYGDFFQSGAYISVKRLTKFPVPGSNVVFGHLPDQTFKLVQVLTQLGSVPGDYRAFLQISPDMKAFSPPNHEDTANTRIRYSQVRLTGHDFLDIGTGNFDETNYPDLPTQLPSQANETVDNNGGRVFFTSTDQDGNFRVGDLFTIEQSTGVATLNADAFNIAGLQELTLGEVTLGGGSASISEFSTDPFFTQDSDNVVPTQRAIKAYIASQIGGGGASLNVNSVTAGNIYIAANQITTVTAQAIQMKATFEFRAGVRGVPLAMSMMLT